MKYLFASGLVISALITVFGIHRFIPIPRAVAGWVMDAGGELIPFSAKTAYVDANLEKSKEKRNEVRYKVSGTAVRLDGLSQEIQRLEEARSELLHEIDRMVDAGISDADPGLQIRLRSFKQINTRLDRLSTVYTRNASALEALEDAEGQPSDTINDLRERLEMVKLDHLRIDALEMTGSGEGGYDPSGPATYIRQSDEIISDLEFDERVRADLYNRYVGSNYEMRSGRERDSVMDPRSLLHEYQHLLE